MCSFILWMEVMVFIVTSHLTLVICFNCKSLCLRWYIHKTIIICVIFAEKVCENHPTLCVLSNYIYSPFNMRYPRSGAADENSTAICILPPVVVLCSSVQRWPQQNWSDISKLHGDETISQCSDFNSTPWGNIVSSHYSSSRGRHSHSAPLLSSLARVFSCAPETKAYVMYKLLNSCHVATKDHSAVIKILKWCLHRNFIIIFQSEVHQTPFTWWDAHMLKWCSLQSTY